MKLLTLAVAIALLGIFGCDEPNQMMQQVTRETGEISETGDTVETVKTAPTTGEILLRETNCFVAPLWECVAGISYTDNSGHITIYFDIPEAIGEGPHPVRLIYENTQLQTDLPNKRISENYADLTEADFFLKRGDTIRFNYELRSDAAYLEIREYFSLYDPDKDERQLIFPPNNERIKTIEFRRQTENVGEPTIE